jgi:hypothetical protein
MSDGRSRPIAVREIDLRLRQFDSDLLECDSDVRIVDSKLGNGATTGERGSRMAAAKSIVECHPGST